MQMEISGPSKHLEPEGGNNTILFTCKSCATLLLAKTHRFSSTSHQQIGRIHLNSFFGSECSIFPTKAIQALL